MADTPEEWRARGSKIRVPDGRIFVADIGPRTDVAPILVLHGFPSSSWDFAEVVALLTGRRRVVLFDFLGFGYSDKPADAGYSLFEQAEIEIAVARSANLTRVHLWAHDMGTSVATELLALRERDMLPFEIASLTLMNGSVHIGMASLTAGQRLLRSRVGGAFARIAGRRVFGAQMRRVLARPVAEEAIDGMWRLLNRADGRRRLPRIIRYLEERERFRRRWIGALERVDVPVLVAWGALDSVARLAIGERLARDTPGATMIRWDDLGHYPQLEDPARVARDVERFMLTNAPCRSVVS